MENRQSRRKKFCSGKIGKVRFVEELELYKIVQDHIFRKCIKTGQKNSSFIRLGFVPEFIFAPKMNFFTKFLCVSEKCGLEQICRARALLQNALFRFWIEKNFFIYFDDFPFSFQYFWGRPYGHDFRVLKKIGRFFAFFKIILFKYPRIVHIGRCTLKRKREIAKFDGKNFVFGKVQKLGR